MPLTIEPAENGALVTFTLAVEADAVQVRGAVESLGDTTMKRVDGVWTLELLVPAGARTVYWYALDGEEDWTCWLPDPGNENRYVYPAELEFTPKGEVVGSLLELPGAEPWRWSVELDVPRGDVSVDTFDGRRVWRYTPAAVEPEALLLVFDGHAYATIAPVPTVLDNMIALGVIPPVAAVMPDSLDTETRMRELACNPEFLGWACDRLLPWAGFAAPRERTVVAGSSMGGLAAAYFASSRPELFGGALVQSGAFPARPFAVPAGLPLRFYLDVGVLEEVLLEPVRAFRDDLVAKGYDVTYREYAGGHDYFWWRETLADGLLALLGSRRGE